MSSAPYLVVAELQGRAASTRITLAIAADEADIEAFAADRIELSDEIVFDFPAKSNQRRIQAIGDESAIKALETMRRRRGGPADLLAWKEGRRWRDVRSDDINEYIQDAIGTEFSAKDFRTWSGTVLAAAALAGEEKPTSDAAAKRTINRAVKTVAAALGNTPAVCRRSYIDPRVFDRYRDGETIDLGRRAAAQGTMSERTRQRIERQVLDLIE
ncbi:MAG: hypothetical protein J0H06_13550 [Actinobacteria bacterium]|nr:hypothetical protein [Actinomycetota bacterium]